MNDALFDWDKANIGHIAEHDVTPEEAEEALLGDPLEMAFEIVNGEERWTYVGNTALGRILRVAITLRDERSRVVTAFVAPKYWREMFWEQKGGRL
jgi:hypothetical protein